MESESSAAEVVADPADAAFLALHAERAALERDLALAQQRQRFGTDPAEIAQAEIDVSVVLAALDRAMTQIRAAEVRRRPGARRW